MCFAESCQFTEGRQKVLHPHLAPPIRSPLRGVPGLQNRDLFADRQGQRTLTQRLGVRATGSTRDEHRPEARDVDIPGARDPLDGPANDALHIAQARLVEQDVVLEAPEEKTVC